MINDGSSFKINSGKEAHFRGSKVGSSNEGKRDFKKVLGKERREDEPGKEKKEISEEEIDIKGKETYVEVADSLEPLPLEVKKRGISLFDLAGVTNEEEPEEISAPSDEDVITVSEFSKEVHEHSLSALFKGYGSKEKLKAFQDEVMQSQDGSFRTQDTQNPRDLIAQGEFQENRFRTEEAPSSSRSFDDLELKNKEKERMSSKFTLETQDLSGVNPQAALETSPIAPAEKAQGPAPVRIIELKEIIDQIIDKLYTISTSGRSDTLIQLKHPPLFAGASVVITTFSSAKGEFNIAFENLTQAAQQLITMKENQEALKFALDQKGYTVHIITATTLSESSSSIEGESAGRDREENEGNSDQQKGKREE